MCILAGLPYIHIHVHIHTHTHTLSLDNVQIEEGRKEEGNPVSYLSGFLHPSIIFFISPASSSASLFEMRDLDVRVGIVYCITEEGNRFPPSICMCMVHVSASC